MLIKRLPPAFTAPNALFQVEALPAPKEGYRRKQAAPEGCLRLHGNSFTRDLSPSLRKPSVGMLGIDEKHVQLSQPSLELR